MNDLGFSLPIGDGIEAVVEFLLDNFSPVFDAIAAVIETLVSAFASVLAFIPWWLMVIALTGVALWRVSRGFAVFVLTALLALVGMGLWDATMRSLSLMIASTLLSLAIGLPLGITAARSDKVETAIRPVLDLMQTMPPFVYLIPAVMFFGLGQVPGTIATVIFSMPPAVRLTNLGIRQVPAEMVEAGLAFGCSGGQLLVKVQLPSALPSIMNGVNQTIMLALSMVVITSMIGAGGLGNEVLRGIQRLDIGLGFEAGLGVVVLAIVLDRLTQSFGRSRGRKR